MTTCCRAPIGQGYGLTETFAGAAFSEWDDPSVGRVGPPLPCCYIKVWSLYGNKMETCDKWIAWFGHRVHLRASTVIIHL